MQTQTNTNTAPEKEFSLEDYVSTINCNLDECKSVIELVLEQLPPDRAGNIASGALYAVEQIIEISSKLTDEADNYLFHLKKNKKAS